MGRVETEKQVRIPSGTIRLEGECVIPPTAEGVVLFAHGSGSSRLSPRNAFVARVLRQRSIGTLLFDLLTESEDQVYETRFDIALLTQRLIDATEWLSAEPFVRGMRLGYFGASTGAAAALLAAAQLGPRISAVVSRGGRPDLAIDALPQVVTPTRLIVGGSDLTVLELNRQAYVRLTAEKDLSVIPGATHLFEEPGALEEAARLAADWFALYLAADGSPPPDR